MNYIKHLSGFFNKVSKDDRLNPTHISLYVSLFQFWNACRFHNPISISRQEAMNVSKISSKVTYHKCIRELHEYGYLNYMPSYNPFKGSLVYLYDFQSGNVALTNNDPAKIYSTAELVANEYHTKIETGTGQALIPYINNTNNSKHKTIVNAISKKNKYEKKSNSNLAGSQLASDEEKKDGKQKLRKKKKSTADGTENKNRGIEIFKTEKENSLSRGIEQKFEISGFKRPLRSQAKIYFAQNSWPDKEAEKFYNHYESNGWMIGKTPMANWEAAASNWILNSENFKNGKTENRAGNLTTPTDKDYGEPL